MLSHVQPNQIHTSRHNKRSTHAYFTKKSQAGETIDVLNIKSNLGSSFTNGGKPFTLDISPAPNNDELGRIAVFIKHSVKAFGFDNKQVDEVTYWALAYIGERANYRLRMGLTKAKHHYISMNFTGRCSKSLFAEGMLSVHVYKDDKPIEQLSCEELHEWLVTHPNTPIYQTDYTIALEQELFNEDHMDGMDAIAIVLTSTALTASERIIDKLEQAMVRGYTFSKKGIATPNKADIAALLK